MNLYEKLLSGEEKLSLVGLGYVGMPIAVAFARKIKVVGFDLNKEKIALYQKGVDPTREVGDEAIKNTSVEFTADAAKLREAKFHIVAVPTPGLMRSGEYPILKSTPQVRPDSFSRIGTHTSSVTPG